MKKNHVNSHVNHIDSNVHKEPENMEVMEVMDDIKNIQTTNAAKSIMFGPVRDELIRQTAYTCYQERNQDGEHALQDWLQAESLVNQMPGKIDFAHE